MNKTTICLAAGQPARSWLLFVQCCCLSFVQWTQTCPPPPHPTLGIGMILHMIPFNLNIPRRCQIPLVYFLPLILGPHPLGTFGVVVDLLGAQCNLKTLWMEVRSSWVLFIFCLRYFSMISQRDGLGADLFWCVLFFPYFHFPFEEDQSWDLLSQ